MSGLKVNRQSIEQMNEESLSMVTDPMPVIGCDKAAEITKQAHATRKTVREIVFENEGMPKE